jgi:hypothetical protein
MELKDVNFSTFINHWLILVVLQPESPTWQCWQKGQPLTLACPEALQVGDWCLPGVEKKMS